MPCIALEGLIGSGKTTVLDILKKEFHTIEEPLDAWTLLPSLYERPSQFAFAFETQVLCSFAINAETEDAIFERSPECAYHVFTRMLHESGTITDNQWKLLGAVKDALPLRPMDAFIFLDCSIEVAFKRIQLRNRPSEGHITVEYLKQLDNMYNEFKLYLSEHNIPFVVILCDPLDEPLRVAAKVSRALYGLHSKLKESGGVH
jgi:deoxyadenosine/deoxycytidine kinase